MSTRSERKQNRIDRYNELARKAETKSIEAFEHSNSIVKCIPMGQPILVGHHSEKRHRRDLDKSWNAMGKSVQESEKAEYYRKKAEAAENNNAIYTEDEDSVERLEEKIARLEKLQQAMKDRNKIVRDKKLTEEEYKKRRADYFYGLDLFGKAVTIYEQILDGAGRHLSGDFRGKVWNNIAACYAKLFCYQKAMHAYENAWNAKAEAEYVKRMYFLTALNPELKLKDKFQEMIGEDEKEVWDQDVKEAREEAEKAPETLKLAAVFEKDPAGRIAAAGDVLNRWKMEYRRML